MKQKPVLGKGLASLFPGAAPNPGVIGGTLVHDSVSPTPHRGRCGRGWSRSARVSAGGNGESRQAPGHQPRERG